MLNLETQLLTCHCFFNSGVTTVLTMLTLATQSTSQNAKHVNSKVTAIDVYLWACFVFVIFAMIEFALSDFTTHSTINSNKNEATAANSKDQSPLVINQLSSCASDVKPSLEKFVYCLLNWLKNSPKSKKI